MLCVSIDSLWVLLFLCVWGAIIAIYLVNYFVKAFT